MEIALPRKQEMVLYAPMTDTQRKLNQTMVDGKLKVGGEGREQGGKRKVKGLKASGVCV